MAKPECLEEIEHRVFSIYKDLLAAGEEITGEKIKARYQGQEERPRMLVEIYQYHNWQVAALVGKEYAPGTLCGLKAHWLLYKPFSRGSSTKLLFYLNI